MQILITGGTGFIGSALIPHLDQHNLTLLTRHTTKARKKFGAQHEYIEDLTTFKDLSDFDAVINLAGENIASKFWTQKQKQKIKESRHALTQELSERIRASHIPPGVLISASAIGFYGDEHTADVTEDTSPQSGFGQDICQPWEAFALACQHKQTRVCIPRIGVVLGVQGGMLQKVLPVFKLGLGGRLGNGQQKLSWIHIDDIVALILWMLSNEQVKGCYNATAPHPVTNAHFTQVLGHILKRPAFFHLPAWLLKIMLGELSELMLKGASVIPQKALSENFVFNHPKLEDALKHLLEK
tara:strand:+ start:1667 stop:2560 length:894 start_codon:yes stop_codon:yes gene_type:complete